MLRLFVGWDLPAVLRQRLSMLAGGLPGASWVPPANLHLTLRFAGEVDEGTAADLDAQLGQIRQAPLRLAIDGLGFFENRGRPVRLWARIRPDPELERLQSRVEQAVQRAGLTPEGRRFLPHISLARLKEVRRLADYLEAHNLLHVEAELQAISLFSSHLGHGEPHYEVERVYPLSARQAPGGL